MASRSMLKAALALVVTALVVCVAAFGWLKLAPRHVPSGQPPLRTIESASLPAFRNAFNANEGEVRILAMLSPT